MAASTGTLSLLALRKERFQSVRAFGLDRIQATIEADLAAHNAIVADMFGELAETTNDSLRLSGSSDAMQMYQGDEYSEAPSQKVAQGTTVGFPMRLWQIPLTWTRKYFEQATPADMAEQVIAAQKAHAKMLVRQMKRSFYKASNYTFFDNLVVPRINLSVKRFVNADSDLIPDGPYGETFDGATHTHYTAHSGIQASDVTALVNTVVEHGHGNKVRLAISPTDETAFRALTGFVAYVDGRLILNTASNQPTQRLDITRINDRPIGVFGAAEVWVKPWAIANYIFCWDAGDDRRPIVLRTRDGGAPALKLAAELEDYPLHTKAMESEFDFGVWTRTNGAVYYFAGGSYTDPTIA